MVGHLKLRLVKTMLNITEKEELKAKQEIFDFLNENIDFAGEPEAIEAKKYELTGKLYRLFSKFRGVKFIDEDDEDFYSENSVNA